MNIKIKTIDDTKNIAKELVKYVKPNWFLLLNGELGAGKTTLTKMLLKELKYNCEVVSPSFNIMYHYFVDGLQINHIDAYRLSKKDDIDMFIEQFENSFNIIEWFENLNIDWSKIKNKVIVTIKFNDEIRNLQIDD